MYRASGKNDEVWNELVQRRNKIITQKSPLLKNLK